MAELPSQELAVVNIPPLKDGYTRLRWKFFSTHTEEEYNFIAYKLSKIFEIISVLEFYILFEIQIGQMISNLKEQKNIHIHSYRDIYNFFNQAFEYVFVDIEKHLREIGQLDSILELKQKNARYYDSTVIVKPHTPPLPEEEREVLKRKPESLPVPAVEEFMEEESFEEGELQQGTPEELLKETPVDFGDESEEEDSPKKIKHLGGSKTLFEKIKQGVKNLGQTIKQGFTPRVATAKDVVADLLTLKLYSFCRYGIQLIKKGGSFNELAGYGIAAICAAGLHVGISASVIARYTGKKIGPYIKAGIHLYKQFKDKAIKEKMMTLATLPVLAVGSVGRFVVDKTTGIVSYVKDKLKKDEGIPAAGALHIINRELGEVNKRTNEEIDQFIEQTATLAREREEEWEESGLPTDFNEIFMMTTSPEQIGGSPFQDVDAYLVSIVEKAIDNFEDKDFNKAKFYMGLVLKKSDTQYFGIIHDLISSAQRDNTLYYKNLEEARNIMEIIKGVRIPKSGMSGGNKDRIGFFVPDKVPIAITEQTSGMFDKIMHHFCVKQGNRYTNQYMAEHPGLIDRWIEELPPVNATTFMKASFDSWWSGGLRLSSDLDAALMDANSDASRILEENPIMYKRVHEYRKSHKWAPLGTNLHQAFQRLFKETNAPKKIAPRDFHEGLKQTIKWGIIRAYKEKGTAQYNFSMALQAARGAIEKGLKSLKGDPSTTIETFQGVKSALSAQIKAKELNPGNVLEGAIDLLNDMEEAANDPDVKKRFQRMSEILESGEAAIIFSGGDQTPKHVLGFNYGFNETETQNFQKNAEEAAQQFQAGTKNADDVANGRLAWVGDAYGKVSEAWNKFRNEWVWLWMLGLIDGFQTGVCVTWVVAEIVKKYFVGFISKAMKANPVATTAAVAGVAVTALGFPLIGSAATVAPAMGAAAASAAPYLGPVAGVASTAASYLGPVVSAATTATTAGVGAAATIGGYYLSENVDSIIKGLIQTLQNFLEGLQGFLEFPDKFKKWLSSFIIQYALFGLYWIGNNMYKLFFKSENDKYVDGLTGLFGVVLSQYGDDDGDNDGDDDGNEDGDATNNNKILRKVGNLSGSVVENMNRAQKYPKKYKQHFYEKVKVSCDAVGLSSSKSIYEEMKKFKDLTNDLKEKKGNIEENTKRRNKLVRKFYKLARLLDIELSRLDAAVKISQAKIVLQPEFEKEEYKEFSEKLNVLAGCDKLYELYAHIFKREQEGISGNLANIFDLYIGFELLTDEEKEEYKNRMIIFKATVEGGINIIFEPDEDTLKKKVCKVLSKIDGDFKQNPENRDLLKDYIADVLCLGDSDEQKRRIANLLEDGTLINECTQVDEYGLGALIEDVDEGETSPMNVEGIEEDVPFDAGFEEEEIASDIPMNWDPTEKVVLSDPLPGEEHDMNLIDFVSSFKTNLDESHVKLLVIRCFNVRARAIINAKTGRKLDHNTLVKSKKYFTDSDKRSIKDCVIENIPDDEGESKNKIEHDVFLTLNSYLDLVKSQPTKTDIIKYLRQIKNSETPDRSIDGVFDYILEKHKEKNDSFIGLTSDRRNLTKEIIENQKQKGGRALLIRSYSFNLPPSIDTPSSPEFKEKMNSMKEKMSRDFQEIVEDVTSRSRKVPAIKKKAKTLVVSRKSSRKKRRTPRKRKTPAKRKTPIKRRTPRKRKSPRKVSRKKRKTPVKRRKSRKTSRKKRKSRKRKTSKKRKRKTPRKRRTRKRT